MEPNRLNNLQALRTSPDFRRFLLRRESSAVVIDLVRDLAPQVCPDKPAIQGIRIDPPEEILANKLCTLLSRSELRDLVDVRALEQRGYSIESAMPLALQKDAGLTPGQLAWGVQPGGEVTLQTGRRGNTRRALCPLDLRSFARRRRACGSCGKMILNI